MLCVVSDTVRRVVCSAHLTRGRSSNNNKNEPDRPAARAHEASVIKEDLRYWYSGYTVFLGVDANALPTEAPLNQLYHSSYGGGAGGSWKEATSPCDDQMAPNCRSGPATHSDGKIDYLFVTPSASDQRPVGDQGEVLRSQPRLGDRGVLTADVPAEPEPGARWAVRARPAAPVSRPPRERPALARAERAGDHGRKVIGRTLIVGSGRAGNGQGPRTSSRAPPRPPATWAARRARPPGGVGGAGRGHPLRPRLHRRPRPGAADRPAGAQPVPQTDRARAAARGRDRRRPASTTRSTSSPRGSPTPTPWACSRRRRAGHPGRGAALPQQRLAARGAVPAGGGDAARRGGPYAADPAGSSQAPAGRRARGGGGLPAGIWPSPSCRSDRRTGVARRPGRGQSCGPSPRRGAARRARGARRRRAGRVPARPGRRGGCAGDR